MSTVQACIGTSLDVARAHATNLACNEENGATTAQLRTFVPTAQVPLHRREEEAAERSDKKAQRIQLMYVTDLVLGESEDTPEKIGGRQEIVDRKTSHL